MAKIIDKGAKERAYNAAYRLQTAAGVKRLLADRHRIGARRFKGDEDASVLLLDLDKAMTMARLTDRQAMAIALVYGLGLTHAEAAAELSVSTEDVEASIESACKRIARIFRRWRYEDVVVAVDDEVADLGDQLREAERLKEIREAKRKVRSRISSVRVSIGEE